jgi:hypothetical protein
MVSLSEHVAQWWDLLNRPIRLTDSVWLMLHPERLRMGSVSGEAHVLTVPVSLDARPLIVTGALPDTSHGPPPPLAKDTVGDGFNITMDGLVDYGTATRAVTSALAGRTFTRANRTVTVQEVTVLPASRGRLVLSLAFEGDANGRLRLIGTPRYDPRRGEVSVPDLDFDLDTDNKIVSGYAWLRSDDLRATIREKAHVPVQPALRRGRALLTSGLNRKLGDAVTLGADVDSVAVKGLYVTRDGLVVRAEALGRARVSVKQRCRLLAGGAAARLGHGRLEGGTLALLREDARDEALALADPLDLDGDRLDGLIDLREPIDDVLRERRHDRGAPAPDPARVGDRDRQDGDEHEDAAEDEHLFGRTMPHLGRALDNGARNPRRGGHLRVRSRDLLVHRIDATIQRGEALLEPGLVGRRELLLLIRGVQPVGDVAPFVLQALHLIAQHLALFDRSLVDGARTRRQRLAVDVHLRPDGHRRAGRGGGLGHRDYYILEGHRIACRRERRAA